MISCIECYYYLNKDPDYLFDSNYILTLRILNHIMNLENGLNDSESLSDPNANNHSGLRIQNEVFQVGIRPECNQNGIKLGWFHMWLRSILHSPNLKGRRWTT